MYDSDVASLKWRHIPCTTTKKKSRSVLNIKCRSRDGRKGVLEAAAGEGGGGGREEDWKECSTGEMKEEGRERRKDRRGI